MYKKLNKNQNGFAHMYLILAVVVIAVVSFAGGNVYNNQQKKKEAQRQAEATAQAEKEKQLQISQTEDDKKTEVDVPKESEKAKEVEEPKTEPKSEPEPTPTKTEEPVYEKKPEATYTIVTIPTTSASVGSSSVVLTAKLPATYSGTCKALVKLPDGSKANWFEASFSSAKTCSVSVPKSKLTAGDDWKFYMYIKSSDGTVKGESGGNLFSL